MDRLMTLMEESYSPEDAAQALEHVNDQFPAVRATSSVVTVEGPADVAILARDVLVGVGQVTDDVDFYVAMSRRIDGPGAFEPGRVNAALVELSDLLRKFTERARGALDSEKV